MERGRNSGVCPDLIAKKEPPKRRADGRIPDNTGYYDCRIGCDVGLDEFSQPISKSLLCPNQQDGVAFCKRIPTTNK